MQITTEDHGDLLELRVAGRLDNDSASHLTDFIDDAVRQGSHAIVMDLTGIAYISSAGIGALVRAYKQLQEIRGFFGVGIAPPHVADVIRLTGLEKMLLCDIETVRKSSGRGLRSTLQPRFRVAATRGMNFELYDDDPGAVLSCDVIGEPTRLAQESYQERHCRSFEFPDTTLGLGLGAFGTSFQECENGFGEFLALAGAIAQQPTTGTGKPDFQLEQGRLIPSIQVAYGLRCSGGLRQHQRFEPAEDGVRIPLSELAEQALEMSECSLAGMVIVAETSGLIGASLKQSPATGAPSGVSRLSHPEIRRWLSFSPERSHLHSLAVVVGVASRGDPASGMGKPLAPLLRKMSPRSEVYGHFHAAVFSYRPFKKRKLDLTDIVGTLFESEDLKAVMHLLNDDREITGGGESEFLRGACWLSPITQVTGGTSK